MPTSTPFANLITFSRGSNATVVGPNGLVQWAPSNLLLNSEQFDNANWTKGNGTVAANTTVAPDGTTTADRFTATAGTAATFVQQAFTSIAAAYTASFYVRASSGVQFVQLLWSSGQSTNHANFDIVNGTVGTSTATSATITAVGSSWYRITITSTLAAAAGAVNVYCVPASTSARAASFTATGSEAVLLWGAQLELGTAATTYNPTTVKNLLGFSEAFDNAAWTKTNSSIVTGAQANPVNGLFNAQKLMENTAANIHYTYQASSVTPVTGNTLTVSAYAKAAERRYVTVGLSDISVGNVYAVAVFDLLSGVVTISGASGTGYSVTATSITAVGNGWYRCSTTCVVGSSVTFIRAAVGINRTGAINTTAGGMESYTGDGNSGIYIYGAQLSDSASLDPYVPTPGAAPSSTAYYGPRFDYDPATLQPRGILIEEQRTNLATYSNDFTDASWVALGAKNLVANTNVSPDGSTNASTLTDNSAAAYQGIQKTVTVANDSTTYTASVYIRKTTGGTSPTFGINLQISGGTTVTVQPRLNTDTGALINGTGTVQNAGAYWRLTCSVTNNSTGNTSLGFSIYPATSSYNVPTDSSAATGSAIIYGAQLEAGAFATSYIPTIASTVTRNGDSLFLSGQNFAQWYRQDAGTWYVEFNAFDPSQNGATFTVSDGTSSNRFIGYPASSVQLEITTGGVLQASLDGGTITTNTNAKVASAYATNDAALSLNGGTAVSDASVTLPAVNQSRIGANVGGGSLLNGYIRSIRFIPVRAADFQLQALTT